MEFEAGRRRDYPGPNLPVLGEDDYVAIACYQGMTEVEVRRLWKVVQREIQRSGRTRPAILDQGELETCLRYWRIRHPISSSTEMPGRPELRAYLAGSAARKGRSWEREAGSPTLVAFVHSVQPSLSADGLQQAVAALRASTHNRPAVPLELLTAEAFLAGFIGCTKRPLWEVGREIDSTSFVSGRIARFKDLVRKRDPELAELVRLVERTMPDTRGRPRR